jgi:DNA-binding transcriptional LysR family regulator
MRSPLARDLADFCRLYQQIELDIVLTDSFSDLNWREADVSVRMAFDVSDDVVGRRLLQYGKAVYAAPGYLESTPRGALIWIGWGPDDPHPAWTRDTPFPDVPVRHRLFGHTAQIEAARAGLGLTMLPCFLGDSDPGLRRVPGSDPIPDRSLWLLLHHALHRTARVRALVDFLADAVHRHRAVFAGVGAPG